MARNWLDRYAAGEDPLSPKQRRQIETYKKAGRRLAGSLRDTGEQARAKATGTIDDVQNQRAAARSATGRAAAIQAGENEQMRRFQARYDSLRNGPSLRDKVTDSVRSAGERVREGIAQRRAAAGPNAERAAIRDRAALNRARYPGAGAATGGGGTPPPPPEAPTASPDPMDDAESKTRKNSRTDRVREYARSLRDRVPGRRTGTDTKKVAKNVAKRGLVRSMVGGLASRVAPLAGAAYLGYQSATDQATNKSNEELGERITGNTNATGMKLAANRLLGFGANLVSPIGTIVAPDLYDQGYDPNQAPPRQQARPAPRLRDQPTARPFETGFVGGATPEATDLYRSNVEAGAPVAIDPTGEEIFANDLAGVDRNGTPMFRDGPNSFSDRGLRGSYSQPADLNERLDSLDRQYRDVRDANRAREEGFDDVDDYRQYAAEQQIRELMEAGLGENAMYEFVRQGGLRGSRANLNAMDTGDQIRLAELTRKLNNDERDFELESARDADTRAYRESLLGLRSDELDARNTRDDMRMQLDLLKYQQGALNAYNMLDNTSKQQFNSVVGLLSNPDTRAAGLAQAQAMLSEDSSAAEALTNYLIAEDTGGGLVDWVANGFQEPPRPMNDLDLRSNYRVVGDELRRGNNWVGPNYPPDILRLLAERLSTKGLQ